MITGRSTFLARPNPFGSTPGAEWIVPQGTPSLAVAPNEVHVWRCSLDLAAPDRDRLERLLSEDERRRIARLRFARDRDRTTAARGWLRHLLGQYLGESPHDVRIGVGPNGKPRLHDERAREKLRFNLSDSQAVAVYAFASSRDVGVDVERVHDDFDFDEIAARFFAGPENAWLQTLDAGDRARGFFRCWTVKEAYVKGRGDGLSFAPETFAIAFRGSDEAYLVDTPEAGDAARWSFRTFEPAEGYAGAVAVDGRLEAVRRFEGAVPR